MLCVMAIEDGGVRPEHGPVVVTGAVDTVGSTMLTKVLSQTRYRGTVAACGLAGGFNLPTTVTPFILRGVRLQGVDSVMAPIELRELDFDLLHTMMTEVPLSDLLNLAPKILAG